MIDRRRILTLTLAAGLGRATFSPTSAETSSAPGISRITAYGFSFAALDGKDIRLSDFAGRPMLIVNTASLCGYTPQYAGLQQLWTEFQPQGLMMIAVPSNDFGGQEPGGASDIDQTAHAQYGVTFPITAKAVVRGPNAHPFYRWAAAERPKAVPAWNFHKYLLGRDGHITDAFASAVEPTDTRIKTAIGRALSAA
ncbi:glutathione peroxidase [Bradyrhizobium sp. 2TAF24]|uniref:glutathione peroxidase n=1 Tax=Bradyrhizobium sp. 2TAF24 TaxID=3233011 RepID=UPI003F91AC3B